MGEHLRFYMVTKVSKSWFPLRDTSRVPPLLSIIVVEIYRLDIL